MNEGFNEWWESMRVEVESWGWTNEVVARHAWRACWRKQQIEIDRLTRERDALLSCRQGDQRCHECPDVKCVDNMIDRVEKRGQA
jgi:hypothetical protein